MCNSVSLGALLLYSRRSQSCAESGPTKTLTDFTLATTELRFLHGYCRSFFAGWRAEPQPGGKWTNHTRQSEKQSATGLCFPLHSSICLLSHTKPRWLQIQFADKNGYPCWSEISLPQRCVFASVKDFLLSSWVRNRQILAHEFKHLLFKNFCLPVGHWCSANGALLQRPLLLRPKEMTWKHFFYSKCVNFF